MDTKEVIISQYKASLAMLREAITKCSLQLWNDQKANNKFWHISYHALFYTDLYIQESEAKFTPWKNHRNDYQFLGTLPWPPHTKPIIDKPYSQQEILEYFDLCYRQVDGRINSMNLGAESGFYWLPFRKLELQFYNIRHIQHHTGALIDRLRIRENIGINWIASNPPATRS